MADLLRTTATIQPTLGSGEYFTQMYWLPGTPGGSTADATDCLDRFRDFWVAVAPKILSGALIVYNPLCMMIDDSTGTLQGAFVGTVGANTTASATGDGLPAQTQGLVTWTSNNVRNGRFIKGRTFVPLPSESDSTNGAPIASYVAQLATGIAAIQAAGATTSEPVIWARPTAPGAADGGSALITGGIARTTWSVLRSRR